MGSHVGTGYKSNYRPLVSYQPHLDTLDNPAIGYSFHYPFAPTSVLLNLSCQRCHLPQAPRQGLGGSGLTAQLKCLGEGWERWKLLGMSHAALSPRTKAYGPRGPSSCFLLPLREQIRDTSKSVTSQSYCPLAVPDGKHPMPWNLYQTTSGYGREKLNTGPLSKEVSAGPVRGRSEPQGVCRKAGRGGSF